MIQQYDSRVVVLVNEFLKYRGHLRLKPRYRPVHRSEELLVITPQVRGVMVLISVVPATGF